MTKKSSILSRFNNLAGLFVLICLIFGGLFVFKIPLLWGSDETFHTMRVYQLAHGQLAAEFLGDTRKAGGYGGQISGSLYGLVLTINHDQVDNNISEVPYGVKEVDNPQTYIAIGKLGINDGAPQTYAFPNTAAYSPVPYVPMLAGMVVAQHYDFSIYNSVILMRSLGLLSYIVIIYFALRILARSSFRWIVFTVALLPMAVFQAAIISVDSMTIAVSLLFFALIVKSFDGDKKDVSKTYLSALFLAALALPLLKPGYVFLSPLLLLVPRSAFGSRRRAVAFKIATLVLVAILFVGWSLLTKDIATTVAFIKPGNGKEAISVNGQVAYLLHSPIPYLVTIIRNSLLNDSIYYTEMIGALGVNVVYVPGIVIVLETLAFLFAVAMVKPLKKNWVRLSSFMTATVACWLVIVTTLYVTFSAVAEPQISGIQGRYFLPIVPFLLVGLALLFRGRLSFGHDAKSIRRMGLVLCSIAIVCLSLSAIEYLYVTGS